MITIQLTADDLTKMRFAYSPLVELVFSYRALTHPDAQIRYRRWIEEAKDNIHDLDLIYLRVLGTAGHYVPDFLTPTPVAPLFDIEEEFQRIQDIPNDQIRKNIQHLIGITGENEILQQFLIYPREMMACVVDDLRLYWQRTLAHHWQRMVDVIEGDVLYHARQLALEGAETLLSNLNENMRFQANRIELIKEEHFKEHPKDYQLTGSGLYLVPTLFEKSLAWQIEPEWQPMILYRSRGTGLWWSRPKVEPDQSLEIALGNGRAQVLRQLANPSSTGEIARRLSITSGAASQHLGRLNDAGLVEPRRSGKRVYYYLTQRGEQLLALFS